MNDPVAHPWPLADPRLAVDLLGTLRLSDGELVDQLANERAAAEWLEERLPADGRLGTVRAELIAFRELITPLFTAIVEDRPPPPGAIAAINGHAAAGPVTLRAHEARDGTFVVERAGRGKAADQMRADLARSVLALLSAPECARLARCRAPGCILFFLKHHPRQQWCSPSCGNRARVARHYARHTQS